jgi:hypothetical protein
VRLLLLHRRLRHLLHLRRCSVEVGATAAAILC